MSIQVLIERVSAQTGDSKTVTGRVLRTFLSLARADLQAGRTVAMNGVGKLSVSVRAQRMARNPRTGVPALVQSKRVVRFKQSSALEV